MNSFEMQGQTHTHNAYSDVRENAFHILSIQELYLGHM